MLTKANFLRSTSVQLSIAYAAIILFAFLFAGALIWFGVRQTVETDIRQYIQLEVSAIETELLTEGVPAAIAAIQTRAERPGAPEYWLADINGNRLAGDLLEMHGPDGWRRIVLEEGTIGAEGRDDMLIFTKTLTGGIRLSVGEDLRRAEILQRATLRSLMIVGSLAVILCVIAGLIVTRRVLARMEALSTILQNVSAGDLSARYPVMGKVTNSDFDDIGIGVNDMLDRIEQLIEGLRRVTRDVAHDLRTPLSHLQQRLEQARTEVVPALRYIAIERAEEKGREILKSFDAILRLAEIEADIPNRRFEPTDLVALADKIVDAYRPDVEESGRSLNVTGPAEARIIGDPDLLAQAVANLIENAMRHTPSGTEIEVSVSKQGNAVILEVSDTGPGIPAEARESVVKPFVRLDASRTTPGSGLGLSIVAAIARLHGADLVLNDAHPGLRISILFSSKNGFSALNVDGTV